VRAVRHEPKNDQQHTIGTHLDHRGTHCRGDMSRRGRLKPHVHWHDACLDQVAYTCASRYARSYGVTLSVDRVVFREPVRVGERAGTAVAPIGWSLAYREVTSHSQDGFQPGGIVAGWGFTPRHRRWVAWIHAPTVRGGNTRSAVVAAPWLCRRVAPGRWLRPARPDRLPCFGEPPGSVDAESSGDRPKTRGT
jgi:hypothetical protein